MSSFDDHDQQDDRLPNLLDWQRNSESDPVPLTQMAPLDRYGIAGFLATIHNPDSMVSGLAKGLDLTRLGLNLESPEYVSCRKTHVVPCSWGAEVNIDLFIQPGADHSQNRA